MNEKNIQLEPSKQEAKIEESRNLKILRDRDPKRLDSFFYADEQIAQIEHKGYLFYAYGLGDINIVIEHDEYDEYITNSNVGDYYHLTDNDLQNEKWTWRNNNWFEISAIKDEDSDKSVFIDLGEIADDYDHAVELLSDINFLDSCIDFQNRIK